jgi:hypothetical protein
MGTERLRKLAEELAARDAELAPRLAQAREAAERLNHVARVAVEDFRQTALERGAEHLTRIAVGPVEPDEKHVDCLQFRIARGRWEAICVVKAEGRVTLVGPFKRGKPEKPCADHALSGEAVEDGLEDLIAQLITSASER